MTTPVKIALAGVGAFGLQHLKSISGLPESEVGSLVGADLAKTREIADRYGIEHVSTKLDDILTRPEIEAVILCTPTPLHAAQAIACLKAGKHVQIEIPLADSLEDAKKVVTWQKRTGLIAMCGHTRRFNSGHIWLRERILAREFSLCQLNVKTHFLRRSNKNALGQPAELD
jgi:2-hydroxy-4-carboxymuconate semialdehyde hemiacetal dehydrogenase